ncbi:hypothetical protein HZF24_11495 [Sedimentibacter hydroxybenzoicus DSM 7310]|uniref:Uncharacterized protein n=1 Tax=Sedimentibacter hydroxybenzoicus DSM 7310 TaxID=1123245 RepID=A0A974BK44_SEDHY|nr:hypothetical protein [Sedimentibacter hydroxybenzoicus]NYB74760.1 hypothetical protein [Sedimentibacter hydroxybenzoicus DSM 7310]
MKGEVMYYYIKHFNPNGDRNVIERYFIDYIIPYIKSNGYNISLCKSFFGLSNEEYSLIVEMEDIKSLETFYKLSKNDDCERLLNFTDKFTRDSSAFVFEDIENDKWHIKNDKFYHMECFNLLVDRGKFEKFFLDEAFGHLRDKGFCIKVLRPIFGKSISEYLFITEVEKLGDIDNWENRTSSDKEGKYIMDKLVSYVDIPRAKVIRCII